MKYIVLFNDQRILHKKSTLAVNCEAILAFQDPTAKCVSSLSSILQQTVYIYEMRHNLQCLDISADNGELLC